MVTPQFPMTFWWSQVPPTTISLNPGSSGSRSRLHEAVDWPGPCTHPWLRGILQGTLGQDTGSLPLSHLGVILSHFGPVCSALRLESDPCSQLACRIRAAPAGPRPVLPTWAPRTALYPGLGASFLAHSHLMTSGIWVTPHVSSTGKRHRGSLGMSEPHCHTPGLWGGHPQNSEG